jgi:hypothetical protein
MLGDDCKKAAEIDGRNRIWTWTWIRSLVLNFPGPHLQGVQSVQQTIARSHCYCDRCMRAWACGTPAAVDSSCSCSPASATQVGRLVGTGCRWGRFASLAIQVGWHLWETIMRGCYLGKQYIVRGYILCDNGLPLVGVTLRTDGCIPNCCRSTCHKP